MKKNEAKNGYTLSRQWFDFAFDHPERISPSHAALWFWIIELNNRLGWKEKFGLPTVHSMEALGISSYNTYKKVLFDLVQWNFIELIEKSRNQYTSNIIRIKSASSKNNKALDKALTKHVTKQNDIDKQLNKKTIKQSIVGLPDHMTEIINYLNSKSGKSFKHTTKKTKDLIKARMGEGFNTDDFKRVIDNKVSQWLTDPKMNEYLRPETLFGTKFESYLNTKISNNGNSEQLPTGEQHRRDTVSNFLKGNNG